MVWCGVWCGGQPEARSTKERAPLGDSGVSRERSENWIDAECLVGSK